MARFYGAIGFAVLEKSQDGIVRESICERNYFGDITRTIRRLETSSEQVIDNLEFKNDISIVFDGYAMDNLAAMRYVQFAGAKWKINSVELRYPRLILSVGGVYNGEPTERAPEDTGM